MGVIPTVPLFLGRLKYTICNYQLGRNKPMSTDNAPIARNGIEQTRSKDGRLVWERPAVRRLQTNEAKAAPGHGADNSGAHS